MLAVGFPQFGQSAGRTSSAVMTVEATLLARHPGTLGQGLPAAPAGVLTVLIHEAAAVLGTVGKLVQVAVVLPVRTSARRLATIVVEAQMLGSGRHAWSVPRQAALRGNVRARFRVRLHGESEREQVVPARRA